MLPSFPLAVRPVGDPSTSCPPPRPPSPLNSTAELLVMSGNHVRPPFAHPAMVTDGLGTHSPRCWTPELLAPACQVSDTQVSDAAQNMSERAITGRCSQHTRVGGAVGRGCLVLRTRYTVFHRPPHFPPTGHGVQPPTSPAPTLWSSGVPTAVASRWGSTRLSRWSGRLGIFPQACWPFVYPLFRPFTHCFESGCC